MKKMLTLTALLTLGLSLATSALAGQHGHYRGHHRGHVAVVGVGTIPFYAQVSTRGGAYFSFGFPAPVFVTPAPVYVAAPAYLVPAPVIVAPVHRRVWVPGYHAYRNGVQIYVQGHWSR